MRMMEQYFSSVLLCLFFLVGYVCYHYLKIHYVFRHFPVHHLDLEMAIKALAGKYPKNVPVPSYFFQETIKKCRESEKEGVCVLMLFRPHVFIYDEKYTKIFYNEPAATEKLKIYNLLKEEYGNGLVLSRGETWKAHRRLLHPIFSLSQLKKKMGIFNRCSVDLVNKLEATANKPTLKTWEILTMTSFNIMAESILGLKFNNNSSEQKIRSFQELTESLAEVFMSRVARPWLHSDYMLRFFPSGRNYLKQYEDLHKFIENVITEMKKTVTHFVEPEEDSDMEGNYKSLGHILLEQHMKDPTFTLQDVRDHLTTFMIAGHETTAVTLKWCLYALGQHPEIQNRAYEEVCSISDDEVTYENLGKLTYIESVIKETLRFFPTIPAFGRTLDKDIHWENCIFPKGTNIVFFTYMLHRNPDIFPNPEKFDPDRFSRNSTISQWTFMPFAEGPRICIGKKFAMMKMKVILVHLLRRFEIRSLNKIEEKDIYWAVILRSLKPTEMLYVPR